MSTSAKQIASEILAIKGRARAYGYAQVTGESPEVLKAVIALVRERQRQVAA